MSLYEQLKQEYPSNAAVARLPLNFLEGEAFDKALSSYFIRAVRKVWPVCILCAFECLFALFFKSPST